MRHITQQEPPQVHVCIEIPRGSFLKRGSSAQLDFVSPFPCPFNYGSIPSFVGGDGDLLDAVVLGPRLPRGARVEVEARGAIGFTDRNIYDDKLICSHRPLRPLERWFVLLFFHFYACCKRLLNIYRRSPGRTVCEGWGEAHEAIARARPRLAGGWQNPEVPF
jgi:inorganic pyrophosphatase